MEQKCSLKKCLLANEKIKELKNKSEGKLKKPFNSQFYQSMHTTEILVNLMKNKQPLKKMIEGKRNELGSWLRH